MSRRKSSIWRVVMVVGGLLWLAGLAIGACHSGDVPAPSPWASCVADPECSLGEICEDGRCLAGCREGADRCPEGTTCTNGYCCVDSGAGGAGADAGAGGSGPCPPDMVLVAEQFCMDRYEASRPDATLTTPGHDTSRATSRAGVLPWFPVRSDVARNACGCVGKRLCTPTEFELACKGPAGTVYPYGNQYDPLKCNGIDTYCHCESSSECAGISPCPYPHCYRSPPAGQSQPAEGCGASVTVMPTGSFPDCLNGYGLYDMSGNVWELVDDGTVEGHYRAGAYNCIDSETLHRCDHVETDILARGFRCCQ